MCIHHSVYYVICIYLGGRYLYKLCVQHGDGGYTVDGRIVMRLLSANNIPM